LLYLKHVVQALANVALVSTMVWNSSFTPVFELDTGTATIAGIFSCRKLNENEAFQCSVAMQQGIEELDLTTWSNASRGKES
jgi:hypothetical protein